MLIYVDESGDLGWNFDHPYGKRGSSRYLTIAAMILPEALDHLPIRKVKQLYKQGKWDTAREKKWVDMPDPSRLTFAQNAIKLHELHQDIIFQAITVKKQNVAANFRRDSNKLYNYMLKLLLLETMRNYAQVTLIPDPRSIKVESGNSLHHYLDMMLYETGAATKLETLVRDSKSCLNLQFVDMLAGVVGTHYEFKRSAPWDLLSPHVRIKELFFNDSNIIIP
jgi:hypothetical protein